MTPFVVLLVRWLVHAAVVMLSVAIVSQGNRANTLGRALLVTLIAAVLVTPFAFFWFLLIPGLIALVVWWLVYAFAYGLGPLQAFGAGVLQAIIGVVIDHLFIRGRLG